MFTTAHLTSGLAAGLALGLDAPELALLAGASVFADWDYAIQLATGRNHRMFLSHCPPVVGLALALLWAAWDPAKWLLLGAMLHFALDLWDYGVRLDPFTARVHGFRLIPGVERMPFAEYLRTYFGDARFLGAEAALAGAAAALAAMRLAGR